ncbi:hypothetical protein RI129_011134 [Pyrocoelia pectoralis]|uniref:Myb/SANT-like DNA-binding domain-containing protein n=1 Tax=Pyrocoelia pectoralis TaxID=417401 RepID=A0AAN7V7D4_9COLE
MNEHSYSYSWDQCQNKWKSLMRTYKSMKDHNNKTGRNRKHWVFFDPIDELMNDNPAIEPPILLHNGKSIGEMIGQSTESPQGSRCSTPNKVTRKRQSSAAIAELFETAIEQNKTQHDENLIEKRRFNDLLEKLINNITSNPGKKD